MAFSPTYICHHCGRRIDAAGDYVIVLPQHEKQAEERAHVECEEAHWQAIVKNSR